MSDFLLYFRNRVGFSVLLTVGLNKGRHHKCYSVMLLTLHYVLRYHITLQHPEEELSLLIVITPKKIELFPLPNNDAMNSRTSQ